MLVVVQPSQRGSITKNTIWYGGLGEPRLDINDVSTRSEPTYGVNFNVDTHGGTKMRWSRQLSEFSTTTQDRFDTIHGRQYFNYDISSLTTNLYVQKLELELDLGLFASAQGRNDDEDVYVYYGWSGRLRNHPLEQWDFGKLVDKFGESRCIDRYLVRDIFYNGTGVTTLEIPVRYQEGRNFYMFSRTTDFEVCMAFSGDINSNEDLFGDARIKKYYGDLTLTVTTSPTWS